MSEIIIKEKHLPRKLRNMEKEELVLYLSRKLRLQGSYLNKLELDELKDLVIQVKKYGAWIGVGGAVVGGILF